MSALRWATVPIVIGVLTGKVAMAAAEEPPVAPTPTPPAAPDTAPAAEQLPDGGVSTVTTTTTVVNAPIVVVAAPITTTTNNYPVNPAAGRLVLNLIGCGRTHRGSRVVARIRRASVRLAPNASLVVRVNGRPITTLSLPSSPAPARRHPPGVALRLRLARNGTLTIRRPSGRVLSVQGCTPL